MSRLVIRNFVVGLFVLAGLSAVAYMSLTIGGLSLGAQDQMTLYAAFDETGGLKDRAPVRIAGVKVGEVASIELDEDYRARVTMHVEAGLELSIDTQASIMTAGLLGDRFILLELGGELHNLADGDTMTWTESAVLLERLIGKLIHNVSLGEDG